MAHIELSDGRQLAWSDYGAPDGAPLFYLHGAGSSRLEPAYADSAARRLGLRLIAVDRPGYGQSTPSPRPGFAAFADDLLQLADALRIERYGAIGMSAGGPYALHLAARAPDRIVGVALINASAESTDAAWRATPAYLRLPSRLVAAGPLLRRLAIRIKRDPARFCARAARREGWDAATVAAFVAATSEGMRQPGAVDTMLEEARRVLLRSWQLDWAALPCPVLALCGERDPGRWFYRAMASGLPQLRHVSIAGGHQPFIGVTDWQRLAQTFSPASVANAQVADDIDTGVPR